MKPADELKINKKLETERDVSNKSYAKILVEKIVFGFITLILIAVIGALLTLIIKK